jgi:hypothetical protein
MLMHKLSFVASLLLSISVASPAFCQLGGEGYHYGSGGARVVSQPNRGYNMPGSTSIGPGTMSQSARGITAVGEKVNAGLPTVHWGSTIGTSGDQQYQHQFMNGNRKYYNAIPDVGNATVVTHNNNLPGVAWGGTMGTAGDGIRSDFHPEINRNNSGWWGQQAKYRNHGQVQSAPVYYNQAAATASY